MFETLTKEQWVEVFGSARAEPIVGLEGFQIIGQFDAENDLVISAEFLVEDSANLMAAALREKYGPKRERPPSDIDLRAFLDVCFGWYGEDDSARPRSREVLAFFHGRHGLNVPSGACISKGWTANNGKVHPDKMGKAWLTVSAAIADDLESIAAQIREILENSDA